TLVLGRLRRGLAVTLLGVAAAGQLLGIGIRADEEQFFALAALYVLSGLVLVVSFVESPARTWHRLRKGISTRRAPSLST
ncbi:MAG TPA: hypothetical protein VGK73_01530, partial [Polyangiaceae bacterium]